MQQAVVTTPKATLYQSVILKNKCFVGQSVSDELLSGWLLTITECRGDFLKVTTHYGYSGWLRTSDVHKISPEEYGMWNIRTGSLLLLTQRDYAFHGQYRNSLRQQKKRLAENQAGGQYCGLCTSDCPRRFPITDGHSDRTALLYYQLRPVLSGHTVPLGRQDP